VLEGEPILYDGGEEESPVWNKLRPWMHEAIKRQVNQTEAEQRGPERMVKASPEWADYIKKMVNAKTAANRQRVELDFLKMRHMERTSEEANARSERKL
jgi:hypothetical protein